MREGWDRRGRAGRSERGTGRAGRQRQDSDGRKSTYPPVDVHVWWWSVKEEGNAEVERRGKRDASQCRVEVQIRLSPVRH